MAYLCQKWYDNLKQIITINYSDMSDTQYTWKICFKENKDLRNSLPLEFSNFSVRYHAV